jgi:hypothetical protein
MGGQEGEHVSVKEVCGEQSIEDMVKFTAELVAFRAEHWLAVDLDCVMQIPLDEVELPAITVDEVVNGK